MVGVSQEEAPSHDESLSQEETVNPEESASAEESVDTTAAKAHIRERGARIRTREQERALRRLRGRCDLSEQEAAVVRDLAQSLTEELLAVPESHLDAVADGETDVETAVVALELFGEE